MFYGCTSLTIAPTILPAIKLEHQCYWQMFWGCNSLTIAPELPATTLANYCYESMFRDCTNLTYIKMLATDISAHNCLYSWVYGITTTGTFIKNRAARWDITGQHGVPNNWTIEYE